MVHSSLSLLFQRLTSTESMYDTYLLLPSRYCSIDEQQVVFGQVIEGKSIVRKIENLTTQADKPQHDAVIAGTCLEIQEWKYLADIYRLW